MGHSLSHGLRHARPLTEGVKKKDIKQQRGEFHLAADFRKNSAKAGLFRKSEHSRNSTVLFLVLKISYCKKLQKNNGKICKTNCSNVEQGRECQTQNQKNGGEYDRDKNKQ